MPDLHLIPEAAASDAERAAVDAVVEPAVRFDGERLARTERDVRHLLLPALHALQDAVGWVSPGGLNHACDRLQVPPADAYGVATFYSLLSLEEGPVQRPHACDDIACRIHGVAEGALANCLGRCDGPPAQFVQGGRAEPAPGPRMAGPLLRRVGAHDPTDIDSYCAVGGGQALARAREIGPDAVIDAVGAAGLLGRGGAAFPAARKWAAVAAEQRPPHYVVVNADESEPGTFKDRVLLEHDPFALVEAVAVAAMATRSTQAWAYVRGEYPLAADRLENAIDQAGAAGWLADGLRLDVRRGAGAYICGEETALFNSIEGYRGEPRNKPPFPTTHGLFEQPTAVNNVETLVNVLDIVTGAGAGETRLFCVSGSVVDPGVYEVPLGTSLGGLIELAGGLAAGRDLQAVLLGGAAGSFVGPDRLDLSLGFAAAREAGVTLGSGAVIVFDDQVDLADTCRRIAAFFRDESCGQCVPCRVGTVRQEEALARGDLALVADVGRVMEDASICGLGHTAAAAITSAADLGLLR